MMVRKLLVTATFSLTACQSAYLPDGRPNEDSLVHDVPAGSTITIVQDLIIGPYQHAIFLQNGTVLEFSDMNKYNTYCAFSVNGVHKAEKKIYKGEYKIESVYNEHIFQVAKSSTINKVSSRNDDNGFDWEAVATIMKLSPDRDGRPVRLLCADWGLPQSMSNLTISGIRKSLGDIAKLKIFAYE